MAPGVVPTANGPDETEETAAPGEEPDAWQEDVQVGAEEIEATNIPSSSNPVRARFTRRLTAPEQPHGKKRKQKKPGCSGLG